MIDDEAVCGQLNWVFWFKPLKLKIFQFLIFFGEFFRIGVELKFMDRIFRQAAPRLSFCKKSIFQSLSICKALNRSGNAHERDIFHRRQRADDARHSGRHNDLCGQPEI